MLKNGFILRSLSRFFFGSPIFEKLIVAALLFSIIMTSCEEPKTGCSDIRATNFDVTAAKADNNSCVFPKLVFQVGYIVGNDTVSYTEKDTFRNALNQPFKILQATTYLSDFQLITTDGKVSKPIDSVLIYRQTDTINVLNSFAMIGRNNGFTYTIGTFDAVGKTFAKCRFNIGLSPDVNKTDATKMLTGPLSIRPDSMYNRTTRSYIFNKIVVASGTNFKDTLRVEMTTLTPIELTKTLPTKEGFDATINLKINYLQYFTGVNFNDLPVTNRQKIMDNAPKIFSLK
jgi:hypothetical protein